VHRRTFIFAAVTPLAAGTFARAAALLRSQGAAARGAPPLPPLSWSCPMHPEVVDNEAGKCPICGMALDRVRLALVYTCPVHNEITEQQPGRCRKCGRDLIRVTKAVSFTCPVHTSIDVVEPGRCPRCKRTLVMKYTVRPHGDHNPKHGGSFFMVSNNWHLEVTHPAKSVFRLYIYDNYSKPFSPPGLAGRIIEIETTPGNRSTVSIPFTRTTRGYYEARVPDAAAPATIAAKVRFEAADKEYRFDFVFPEYSKEPTVRLSR
jgi:Cu(I)/Ag(I) efflux system membrane fusion protein